MNHHQANLYLNFVLYAITGRLAEADSLLRDYRRDICLIAIYLREHYGVPPGVHTDILHRGILIEPELIKDGRLPLISEPSMFASFSEDPMVAACFADTRTYISELVLAHRPRVTGWIMRHDPDKNQILFHWTWRTIIPFKQFSILHPLIDAQQFLYALDTQKEVIITNHDLNGRPIQADSMIEVTPYDGAYQTEDLNRKFLPPQFRNIPRGSKNP